MRSSLRISNRRQSTRRRGFTLMEVLLVLAILVILGSIVTVSVLKMQATAFKDAARTQLRSFEDAIKLYQLHVNQVPSNLDSLVELPADLPNQTKWQGPYIDKQIPLDPWDQPYQYEVIDDERYNIFSAGPDRTPSTDDDITL
ncbi:Type II secretion system protein G precursor [Anatilimnocola aggregata]|uniref:Type II secretion system core protein G n=1 Tax=Anatilimnocola aggregata TaxID=2528021 RepID=A0A517Y7F3_9BACT|nr:type II secretion system major pseudopilin GspG [Anatilimnocola aggregata]QDU26147.1 Type II secretion system protein G precursor [Anatilimnocola aggregata]